MSWRSLLESESSTPDYRVRLLEVTIGILTIAEHIADFVEGRFGGF